MRCIFLQRANEPTGSFRGRTGDSRSSSEEISFWTKRTGYSRTTNSRYSVRYIPLYVIVAIVSLLCEPAVSPGAKTTIFQNCFAGKRRC